MTAKITTNAISCRLCGEKTHLMELHLRDAHPDCTLSEYLEKFPGAPVVSDTLASKWNAEKGRFKQHKKYPVADPTQNPLAEDFTGILCKVNLNVPASDCLPLPPHYRTPTHGELGKDIALAMENLVCGSSLFISGPPGTGKDALIHAFAANTRRPSKLFQVQPQTDVQEWLYSMGFNTDGVIWEIGDLLAALKDGYISPKDGKKMPYLILVSDFDRATPEQAEVMRMITDSIQGRVQGPKGRLYEVVPGTQIIFTGNSCGSGDERGLCISANIMDSSLLDRIQAKIKFHNMHWNDESPILRAKFPDVVQRIGERTFAKVGDAINNIRKEIENEKIHAEFSHRTACNWMLAMRNKIKIRYADTKLPKGEFLSETARVFLDALTGPNRTNAEAAMNAHISGGIIDEGDISHINLGQDLAASL